MAEFISRKLASRLIEETLDRRGARRVSFGAELLIADLCEPRIPPPDRFRRVKAHDLSQSGVAFAASQWPKHDRLAIMLGNPDRPAYATARIVSCTSQHSPGDSPRYEVRCEFDEIYDQRPSTSQLG